jgi:phosphoglycerol transferase
MKKYLSEINSIYITALPFAMLFIFILARNAGLYPSVVDEYYYNMYARQMSFDMLPAPNYLYSLIFKSSDFCRVGWLECVRILNLLLYFSAAPIIYSISRRFTGAKLAILIVFISLAGVSNSYTAYFMPEATYFLVFWALVWMLIDADELLTVKRSCLAGLVLGLLSLIKPHGLFLIAPIFIYLAAICFINKKSFFYLVKIFIFVLLSCLGTKFLVSILLAGKAGITIFGTHYSQHAADIMPSSHLISVINFFFYQYLTHLGFIALLFSVPLANGIINSKDDKNNLSYFCFTLIFISFLVAVSAFYTTALNFQIGVSEGLRLHMRYYSFAFPLILILGGIKPKIKQHLFHFPALVLLTILLLAFSFYFIATGFSPFTPNYVDGPEIRGFTVNKITFYSLSFLSVLSLIFWSFNAKKGVILYFAIFIPAYLISTNYYIGNELRNRMFPGPFDNGALVAKTILSHNELSKLIIIGAPETLGILDLSKIYYDNQRVITRTIPENSILDSTNIPKDIEWILYVGNYTSGFDKLISIDGPSFKLIKISNK